MLSVKPAVCCVYLKSREDNSIAGPNRVNADPESSINTMVKQLLRLNNII
jgi:hypothetical protein